MATITSSSNPRIRRALKLHESRGRRQQQRIIVFGMAEIGRAVDSGIAFEEAFVCYEQLDDGRASLLDRIGVEVVQQVSTEIMRKLSFGDRQEGLVAIAERPSTSLENFQPRPNYFCIVLESIEKPGNIGAIFRSADAAGVDAILMADPVCDLYHPSAIRASLGTVFSVPAFTGDSSTIKQALVAGSIRVLATRVDATRGIYDANCDSAVAVAFGSEARGLSDVWNGKDVEAVRIPMQGSADSLNVSVSAAVVAFEISRQRRSAGEGN